MENRGKKCHRFWLRLRNAVILISNDRTSTSKKINGMTLIRTLMVSTTAFERTKGHRFWLRLRNAVILISNDRTSTSKKINGMTLIRTLMVSTTAFERTKEKFYGFRQTVDAILAPCLPNLSKHDLKQVPEGGYRNLNSAFSE